MRVSHYMKLATNTLLKLLPVLLLATATLKAEDPDKVAELIGQAHKHDNMYTLGPEAGQQEALNLYQSALAAEPDRKQQLHILYRMAQLNICRTQGNDYDIDKQKSRTPAVTTTTQLGPTLLGQSGLTSAYTR